MEQNRKLRTIVQGETLVKRRTRSVHEKQRRIEMNMALAEMAMLLPGPSCLTKKPDKCYVIEKSVEFIRNSDYPEVENIDDWCENLPSGLYHSLTSCIILQLKNTIICNVAGDPLTSFGIAKEKLLKRDVRCIMDFSSATEFSIVYEKLDETSRFSINTLRGQLIECVLKKYSQGNNDDGKGEKQFLMVMMPMELCEPDMPPKNVSKLAEERPILAAMLMKDDKKDKRDQFNPDSISINTEVTASLNYETASNSSSFLSPESSSSICSLKVRSDRKTKRVSNRSSTSSKKRLRSANVIVESYSLDDEVDQVSKKRNPKKCAESTSSTPSLSTSCVPALNPYEILPPGYRDIWLRLQRERMILEKRVMEKEKELQQLILSNMANGPTPEALLNSTSNSGETTSQIDFDQLKNI